MEGNSMETRITNLETKHKILTAQFMIIVTMGIGFWGVVSKFVYDKLDTIDTSIERLYGIDTQVQLINYRLNSQDILNGRLVNSAEEYRKQVQTQFEILHTRITNMQSNKPTNTPRP